MFKHALALSILLAAPGLVAQTPRRPRGVYAVVNTEGLISQQQKANPSITPAQLNAYFSSLYQDLLSNPAISGLALQVHWDTLNPAANAYDWSLVDSAFAQAAARSKTIQLILMAGFQSPQWVLNQIPSCDGLFQSPAITPPGTCGKVTFTDYLEEADGTVLPLPWNPFYKTSWSTFLTALAARYGANPAFVSISVSGPTAASAEIIMPNNGNSGAQDQFGGIMPNEMWRKLLAFHYPGLAAYQNSDEAFIDEWNAAIDMFGQVFSRVTLVVATGDGLPNFSSNFTIPSGFTGDCPNPVMDCAAETTILAHFVDPSAGGANAKATQTSGLEAARGLTIHNLGLASVKLQSQSTARSTTPSAQILGGAQFNTSFSKDPVGEGCTSAFPPDASDTPAGCIIPSTCAAQACMPVACIPQACLAPGVTQANLSSYKQFSAVPGKYLIAPEQAGYNVLNVYFDGTAAAGSFGGTQGTTPLNYLQVYSEDIQYAEANANAPAQVMEGGATVAVTAQDLLNLASQKVLQIGEPALLPAIGAGGIVPGTIQPGEWVSIYGTNLAAGTATWTGNFPTLLGGTSVTIDGKAAYLSFAGPGQINLQAPDDTATGTVPVVVTTAIGSVTSTVKLAQFGPSFFLLDAKHAAAIILRSDGTGAYGGGAYDIIGPTGTSLGYPTVAAKAGDTIELFGTGFGPTIPAAPAGQAFSGAAVTASPVTILINGVSVTPAFAGLSGAGVYQINLTVPAGVGPGDVSLQASVGGTQTAAGVVISVQ